MAGWRLFFRFNNGAVKKVGGGQPGGTVALISENYVVFIEGDTCYYSALLPGNHRYCTVWTSINDD